MKKYLLFLFFVVSHLWALADGEWALVGLKYVIHKTDNNCTGEFHNGMAIVQDAWNEQGYYDAGASQLYGAIDTSGKLVIPCIYQSMTDFINGFSVVEKDGKYGILNTRGGFILPLVYTSIEQDENIQGLYVVKQDQKEGLFYNGQMIFPLGQYEKIKSDHFPFVEYTYNNKDYTYNFYTSQTMESHPLYLFGHAIFSTPERQYYTLKGEPVNMQKASVSSKGIQLFRDEKTGLYGFRQASTGKVVVQPKYTIVDYDIWIGDVMVGRLDFDHPYVIINASGQEIPFQSAKPITSVFGNSGIGYLTGCDDNSNTGLFSYTGKVVLEPRYVYVNEAIHLGPDWYVYADSSQPYTYNVRWNKSFPGLSNPSDVGNGILLLWNSERKMSYYVDLKTGKQIGGYFENGEPFRGGLAKVNDNEFINTQGKVVLNLSDLNSIGDCFSEGVILAEKYDHGKVHGYVYNPMEKGKYAYNQKDASAWTITKWMAEGDQLQLKKNFGEAKDFYYRVMMNDPKNVLAAMNYGYCIYQLGHYDEALEAYSIALDLEPDNAMARKNYNIIKGEIEKRKTTQQEQAESPTSNNIWGALANFGNMILQTYAAVNGYSASSQDGSMDYSFTDTDSSVSSGSSSGQEMSTSTYQSIYSRWERQAKSNYESLTLLGGKYTSRNGDKSGVTGGNWNTAQYTQLKRLLREAQREMHKTRSEAARNGVNIPQSKWETATVSY